MTQKDAVAEVFFMAFQSLSQEQQQAIFARTLQDQEEIQDQLDIHIAEQRKDEPLRPFEDYLSERRARRR